MRVKMEGSPWTESCEEDSALGQEPDVLLDNCLAIYRNRTLIIPCIKQPRNKPALFSNAPDSEPAVSTPTCRADHDLQQHPRSQRITPMGRTYILTDNVHHFVSLIPIHDQSEKAKHALLANYLVSLLASVPPDVLCQQPPGGHTPIPRTLPFSF